MGTKDQVAIINHVLKTTGQKTVSYMGHSEGVTQLLAGTSLMPDFFNEKINVALLLAPPASMVNAPVEAITSKDIRFIAQPEVMSFLTEAAEKLFMYDIIPYKWYQSKVVDTFCLLLDGKVCELIFAFSQGYDLSKIDDMELDRELLYLSNLPSDACIFDFVHYGQLIYPGDKKETFRRFDHGKELNMKKYNQSTPPEYDLKKIKIPLAIFSGSKDILANPKDVAWFKEQVKETTIFAKEYDFDHFSFQIAYDMTYFTDTGMKILNEYNFG